MKKYKTWTYIQKELKNCRWNTWL